MAELKPCPFCGGAACKFVNLPLHGEKTKWGISCMVCYAKTQPRETIEEAIEAWNRRADT